MPKNKYEVLLADGRRVRVHADSPGVAGGGQLLMLERNELAQGNDIRCCFAAGHWLQFRRVDVEIFEACEDTNLSTP